MRSVRRLWQQELVYEHAEYFFLIYFRPDPFRPPRFPFYNYIRDCVCEIMARAVVKIWADGAIRISAVNAEIVNARSVVLRALISRRVIALRERSFNRLQS